MSSERREFRGSLGRVRWKDQTIQRVLERTGETIREFALLWAVFSILDRIVDERFSTSCVR